MADPPLTIGERVNKAIAKLQGLREGCEAIQDLVACGQAAINPLREFLFTRNPSGIFQPRCDAVQALAALGARDVLLDFLACPRNVVDPTEQAGEDAVTNAVARALINWPDDQVFSLLFDISQHKLLAGVIEALAEYRREETMPIFAAALKDDFCRPAAEKAFRKLGALSCPYLLQLAVHKAMADDIEYDSSRRRRRSALRLFAELHRSDDLPETVRWLIEDKDPQVALLACSICLPRIIPAERRVIAARLIILLDNNDWMLRTEVEDLLIRYHADCRPVVEKNLTLTGDPAAASLQRVMNRIRLFTQENMDDMADPTNEMGLSN